MSTSCSSAVTPVTVTATPSTSTVKALAGGRSVAEMARSSSKVSTTSPPDAGTTALSSVGGVVSLTSSPRMASGTLSPVADQGAVSKFFQR